MIRLPDAVEAMAGRGADGAAWVDGLPRLVQDLLDQWGLSVEGPPTHGYTAVVVPVRTASGEPAMLKVGFPDDESEHEHLALQHWHGRGAVRLLRADPRRRALLLEKLHGTDLRDLWDIEACEIVAGLYASIHVPAVPQLRTLSSYVDRWVGSLERLGRDVAIPRRMVEQAISLGRRLESDELTDGTMIHCDLHYENVLAADRSAWLVIDPKPMSGDPHYEVAPMLWNRFEELEGDVRGGVRRRFHALIDAAGLDEDRARDWVVLRMILNAAWAIDASGPAGPDPDYLTMCLAVAKAVQD
ncbi:streptomycin 6-kinase [Nocardioides salsibiostraticola]